MFPTEQDHDETLLTFRDNKNINWILKQSFLQYSGSGNKEGNVAGSSFKLPWIPLFGLQVSGYNPRELLCQETLSRNVKINDTEESGWVKCNETRTILV